MIEIEFEIVSKMILEFIGKKLCVLRTGTKKTTLFKNYLTSYFNYYLFYLYQLNENKLCLDSNFRVESKSLSPFQLVRTMD